MMERCEHCGRDDCGSLYLHLDADRNVDLLTTATRIAECRDATLERALRAEAQLAECKAQRGGE